MKKIKQKGAFTKKVKHPLFLPAACYVIMVVCWLVVCLGSLVTNAASIANGTLVETTLISDDFILESLVPLPDGRLQATDDDPQMILQNPPLVRSFRLYVQHSSNPYEINLYYTTKPGQPFGKDMRVWPVLQGDGSYLFTLPQTHIEALRLDPASAAVQMEVEKIVLNQPRTIISYFNPGWAGLVLLLVLPAFAAAVLRWVLGVVQWIRMRTKK
ncbi:hypothetical protein LJC61_08585 [Ruminococcaceae bacterium OttesenSCG-928-A16]|nr:hypothetical protein [Ruminococcaceae bacterium OttesenSCG-928-A16]